MTTIADPAGGRCAIRNTCAVFLDPRTGDFVEALIDNAQDIDEYAFALGALGHYTADNYGHPMAVNRTVPLMYPKLKTEFGNSVIYAQSPKSHVLVEFSFDVEMTKVAWSKKRNEIMKVAPGTQRKTSVFNLRRKDYDKEFGADYAKPHGFARFLGVVYRIAPKIGPFRSLVFRCPRPKPNACSWRASPKRGNVFASRWMRPVPGVCDCRMPISTRDAPRRAANIRSPTPRTTNCSTSSLPAASPASPWHFARTSSGITAPQIHCPGAGRGKAIGEDPAPTGVAHRDADLVNRSVRPA